MLSLYYEAVINEETLVLVLRKKLSCCILWIPFGGRICVYDILSNKQRLPIDMVDNCWMYKQKCRACESDNCYATWKGGYNIAQEHEPSLELKNPVIMSTFCHGLLHLTILSFILFIYFYLFMWYWSLNAGATPWTTPPTPSPIFLW
jgi:hypothetical protein